MEAKLWIKFNLYSVERQRLRPWTYQSARVYGRAVRRSAAGWRCVFSEGISAGLANLRKTWYSTFWPN